MSRIKSIGMAEARPRLTQLVDEVSGGGEPYLIVSGSRVKAVLIGLNQYNDMIERLEDLSDTAELLQAELEQEPTMPFEKHLAKLKVYHERSRKKSEADGKTLDEVSERFRVPKDRLADYCRRHHIKKLSLFGSVLRDDFGHDSDVDVLVEFEPGHVPGFAIIDMENELSKLVGRKVDIRTPGDLSRYFRDRVVKEARVEYAQTQP
ncbi:MAG: type II toxin-antitoxin system prevent-host-death family antitoxin [Chloroflexota bacterium]